MRINKFVANATGLSRRAADKAIAEGRVLVNRRPVEFGQSIQPGDEVQLDKRIIKPPAKTTIIMLNKPRGYVCSRVGQGSRTIYNLLPPHLRKLKPVGRLDKDSSGLLLMTDDGQLSYELTHPSFQKTKIYEVKIDKPLAKADFDAITKNGVDIGGTGLSRFQLQAKRKTQNVKRGAAPIPSYFLPSALYWRALLAEGRNRQIRRTFEALGYTVTKLHRTQFGEYRLNNLAPGNFVIT